MMPYLSFHLHPSEVPASLPLQTHTFSLKKENKVLNCI
jgi:hypothetical protein